MTEIDIAKKEDLQEILHMIKKIYEALPCKDWFSLDEDEILLRYMEQEGFALKATFHGELAGVFIVRTERLGKENLGYDLGFSESQREKVAHMEIAMVKEAWRGQGLQAKMMKEAEEILRKMDIRYLLGTAHPDNKASAKSFLKMGYEEKMTKEKYGGLLRCIFCKEI